MQLLSTIALSAAIAVIGAECRFRPGTRNHHHSPEAGCDNSCGKADGRGESRDFQGVLGASRRRESPWEGAEKVPRGMQEEWRQTILSDAPRCSWGALVSASRQP